MPVLGRQVDRPNGQFLYIPLSRFIIMSLVTLGIYQNYWIFKNWEYLKNRDNLNIHPFWRGIFGFFFCHELLKAIHDDPALNQNKTPEFNHSLLATGWVIIIVIQAVLNYGYKISSSLNSSANGFIFYYILVFALVGIQTYFLVPVQRYINDANEKIEPTPYYYPWSAGHFIVIGLVIVLFLLGFIIAMNTPAPVQTYNIPQVPTLPVPPVYFTETTIVPQVSIPPSTPTPSAAVTTPQPGWENITVPEDNFEVYIPTSWNMDEINMPPINFLNNVNVENIELTPMNKIVMLSNQNTTISTIIDGTKFSKLNNINISDKDLLTQFLKAYVISDEQGMKERLNVNQDPSLTPESFDVTIDPNIYNLNGYNTEKLSINPLDSNGNELIHIQIYIIETQDSFYIIQDAYSGTAVSDLTSYNTTDYMLKSFTPTI